MPKRVPVPGTDILPNDILPAETSQTESNELSLRAFFYDYCVGSAVPNLSRGFHSGLEAIARRKGLDSDLVRVCQAVSFAAHGKTLNRPVLVHKADLFYQEVLASLAKNLQDPRTAITAETKWIAMLLGVYQIIMSDMAEPGSHDAHAKGLAALMNIGSSPLSLLGSLKSGPDQGYIAKKIKNRNLGVFSIPALNEIGESLDRLLSSLNSLWKRSQAPLTPTDAKTLRDDGIALDFRFTAWQGSRPTEFKPITIGNVSQSNKVVNPAAGYWPGKVDTYFDLYVAGVWNIFRTARLLLLALIIRLSEERHDTLLGYISTATQVAEDMLASISYHLTDDLQAFISQLSDETKIADPGKIIGGLLLMHPLYAISELSFIDRSMKEYSQTCLIWIGSEMGVGQATLLANTPGIDKGFLASACMIIWSAAFE